MTRLAGKVAFITGAAAGIGRATAVLFARGLIQPEDIANAALYLASEESRMVTGQILPVDSGVTIA